MLTILVTLILPESMAVSNHFIVSSKVEDVFNETLRVNYILILINKQDTCHQHN